MGKYFTPATFILFCFMLACVVLKPAYTKHVAPHYDITPALSVDQIKEFAEEVNDETLIEDASQKKLIEEHKKKLEEPQEGFRTVLAHVLETSVQDNTGTPILMAHSLGRHSG